MESEYMERMHRGGLYWAWKDWVKCDTPEDRQQVRRIWGDLLTEALERQGKLAKLMARNWKQWQKLEAEFKSTGDKSVLKRMDWGTI